MLEALNVPEDESLQAVELVRKNIDWLGGEAASELIKLLGQDTTSTDFTTETTTTARSTTQQTSTETTTLAGNQIIFSAVLGVSCAIMRQML